MVEPSRQGDCREADRGHLGPARARVRPRQVELAARWPCRPADRQVRPAGPEEGPAPVWHPGQRGPYQRLEHHPDRREAGRGPGGAGGGEGRGPGVAWRGPLRAQSQPASPAVPLLRGLQLHRLVRGLQRHACPRLLLPGVQRELRAARARHLVESGEPVPSGRAWLGPLGAGADLPASVTPTLPPAVLRDREDVAPGEPAGRGRLRAVHGAGAGRRPHLSPEPQEPGS